ncbi:MAG: UDP-N-acetyl glucosamine 2-epimerase [Candidatus Altiarchaeota archaeon]|nr:UDP-N-acetyl glucosamine 2-epimerase [Candidatus Altiarchaeota archaeon]
MVADEKIAFVIGTMAELIKCFPVMQRLRDYTFIHTGQHDLGELIELFNLKEPNYVVTEPPKAKSSKMMNSIPRAVSWNLRIVPKIKKILKKEKPEIVCYHGDTMSTVSGALASRLAGIKGAHLEAGLRSGNIWEPFPEEIARRLADRNSSLLFAVSKQTAQNLRNEKINGRIINTGNTIVDSATETYKKWKNKFKLPKQDYAIITIHRFETLKSRARMRAAVDIINSVPIKKYFFIHDNTVKALRQFGLGDALEDTELLRLSSYPEFIVRLANSRLLLTDGGSVQEESLVFRKPCLLLRETTERTEGLDTGLNFLTKLDLKYSKQKIDEILSDDWKTPRFTNPYGEPGVSNKIIKYLRYSE